MVNATEMAKPICKRPMEWLRLKSTNDFLYAYATEGQISPLDLIEKNHGGDTQGIWVHQDLALEFAIWLSPEFALWRNDRIKNIVH